MSSSPAGSLSSNRADKPEGSKPAGDDAYDLEDDMRRSIAECFRAVKARVAAGGAPWVPKDPPQREETK